MFLLHLLLACFDIGFKGFQGYSCDGPVFISCENRLCYTGIEFILAGLFEWDMDAWHISRAHSNFWLGISLALQLTTQPCNFL